MAHRHQCWFDADMAKFELSSAQNLGQEPHPALMNSIYLLACHFARSPHFSEIEPLFFTRALQGITAALDASDRLVDIVQASCLLATYLYVNCRTLEAYCHAFSAARLAVGLGLHQIQVPQSNPMEISMDPFAQSSPQQVTSIPIAPPRDATELRDRISAFWQVFMVDRCWSASNGLPAALPDGDYRQARIKTPWPNAPAEQIFVS